MFTFLLTFFSSVAFAQNVDQSTAVIYAPETHISFVEMEVDGDVVKPGLTFVTTWRQSPIGSMIELRTSFDMEIQESVLDIE